MSGEEDKRNIIVAKTEPIVATISIKSDFILVKDAVALAKRVLDYLRIKGQERNEAETMIGEGEKEADRISIFLMARQMKRQETWNCILLVVALAGLGVAILSLVN